MKQSSKLAWGGLLAFLLAGTLSQLVGSEKPTVGGLRPELQATRDEVPREGVQLEEGSQPRSRAEGHAIVGADPREAAAPSLAVSSRTARVAPEFPLVLRFSRSDRKELTDQNLDLRLENEAGESFQFAARSGIEFRGEIPLGVYRVDVVSESFGHTQETFDFSDTSRCENGDPAEGFFRRVYLWPTKWLPVILRTSAGESFESITEKLGYKPKYLFYDAFRIAASHEEVEANRPAPERNARATLARFLPPKGNHQVRIADDVIGSLEVLRSRPFWITLWIHGAFFESRYITAKDTEIVFVTDLSDFTARFAEVRLRLLDRDSKQPVGEDTSATLKANTSSHRRSDLRDQVPSEDGRILFRNVIPGQYELTILRAGNNIQRKLNLAAGETLDLGELEIGSDAPLLIRVVDSEGRPVLSTIEVASYQSGRSVDDLYHPNLHRSTQPDGTYVLPLPETVSIVRARPKHFFPGSEQVFSTRGGGTRYDIIGTRNLRFDPKLPPTELVLVMHPPVSVPAVIEGSWARGHRVLIIDEELDLVIRTVVLRGQVVSLVPGPYRLSHFDSVGQLVGSRTVQIEHGTKRLSAP